jgi:L-rhamnose mutarotase
VEEQVDAYVNPISNVKGKPMKLLLRFAASVLSVLLLGCGEKGNNQSDPGKKELVSAQTQTAPVKRYCLALELKNDPALIKEYRHWHDSKNIWPEIPKGIREVGITDMEIYLVGTKLFMIMEAGADFDFDKQMAKLADLPRQKEWEAFVSKFQKSSPDAKSSEKWKMMERIFKLPQ